MVAGAGDEATASAVIADLNDIINNQTSNHIPWAGNHNKKLKWLITTR